MLAVVAPADRLNDGPLLQAALGMLRIVSRPAPGPAGIAGAIPEILATTSDNLMPRPLDPPQNEGARGHRSTNLHRNRSNGLDGGGW